MKKLVLGAAIAAALTATGAQAVSTITVDANGIPTNYLTNSNVLYLSGATAAEKFIEKLVTDPSVPAAKRICRQDAKVYKFQDVAGTEQYAYLCEREPTNTSLPTNKPYILLYKRSAGGSAFGVSPIVADANDEPGESIEFLNLSTCSPASGAVVAPVVGVSFGVIKCDYNPDVPGKYQTHISDFGISDVDPAQFTGVNSPLNPATGSPYPDVSTADVAKLDVKPASALTFGVPVTTNLYVALQAAQVATGALSNTCLVTAATNVNGSVNAIKESEACMPSLTSAQVASIHAGTLIDWNQLKVNGVGLYAWALANPASVPVAYLPGAGSQGGVAFNGPSASAVHTCRRENGSGTQTQSNIKFLNASCSGDATPPQGDAVAQGAGEGEGLTMVHENSSSGQVDICLNELQDGTNVANSFANTYGKRWAVGIQSLEKKTSSTSKYRFVKLDGVTPTLDNVAKGKYRDWAENTFQYATVNHTWANTSLQSLADAIISSAGAPEVMAALNNGFTHTFTTAKGAYMAVPSSYDIEPNGVFNPVRPVNTYSHATSSTSVNNCRTPAVYNNGTTSPVNGAVSGDSSL